MTFDPNKFNVTKSNLLKIPAVEEAYEPGSTGKVMTFAAALQEKLIEPTTVFQIPDKIKRADRIFNDHEPHPKWKLTCRKKIIIPDKLVQNTLVS